MLGPADIHPGGSGRAVEAAVLALQFAEKTAQFVETNERLLTRTGSYGYKADGGYGDRRDGYRRERRPWVEKGDRYGGGRRRRLVRARRASPADGAAAAGLAAGGGADGGGGGGGAAIGGTATVAGRAHDRPALPGTGAVAARCLVRGRGCTCHRRRGCYFAAS